MYEMLDLTLAGGDSIIWHSHCYTIATMGFSKKNEIGKDE